MSAEIAMRREGDRLAPVDPVSAEMLAEIPTTKDVLVTVKSPRNMRQFKLAWALADIISKSVDFLPDRETAMNWLKIKSRHVQMITDGKGNTAIIPKSIAFASLDQEGFSRLFNRMIHVTITQIIPGMAEDSLRAEIEKMVGIEAVPAKPERKPAVRKPPPHDPETGEVIEPPVTKGVLFYSGKFNVEEWTAWTKAWLTAMLIDMNITDQDVMIRWRDEHQLRVECGVNQDNIGPMFKLYSETLERIRNRRKT
jgi:hypothetical protein